MQTTAGRTESEESLPASLMSGDLVKSPPSSLLKRVATALVLGALTVTALFTTHALPIVALAVIIGAVGFVELVRIAGIEDRPLPALIIGLLCYVAPVVVAWMTPPGSWYFWAVVWAAYLAGCIGVAQGLRRGYATPMSAGWLGAPLATILVTHQQTVFGTGSFAANASFMLLVPLWVGDTAAMFIGRSFGKNKLAPSISPSKTWEGAIANFVACLATSLFLGGLFHLPWLASLLVGVLSGVLGQVGDLAQSALKRVTGLKDSGDALPGHGGVLDRMDSFLLSSVPGATVLWILVPHLYHTKLWP